MRPDDITSNLTRAHISEEDCSGKSIHEDFVRGIWREKSSRLYDFSIGTLGNTLAWQIVYVEPETHVQLLSSLAHMHVPMHQFGHVWLVPFGTSGMCIMRTVGLIPLATGKYFSTVLNLGVNLEFCTNDRKLTIYQLHLNHLDKPIRKV